MKRILIIAMFLISACHNIDPKQERAERLAKAYINQHLSNYDKLTFSKLTSLRTHYFTTPAGIKLSKKFKLEDDSVKKLEKEDSILDKNFKANIKKIEHLERKMDTLNNAILHDMIEIANFEKTHTGKLLGYKLCYTYKVQDKFEPVYHKITFKMDTLLSHITFIKDTTIDQQDVSWE